MKKIIIILMLFLSACVKRKECIEIITNIDKIYRSGYAGYKFIIFDEKKKVANFSEEYDFYYNGLVSAHYEFYYDIVPAKKHWVRIDNYNHVIQFHIHGPEDLPEIY